MASITIRPATLDDIREVAAHIREPDRLELEAATGHTPEEALVIGLQEECWSASVGPSVLAVWGVGNGDEIEGLGMVGVGWLLTTEDVDLYPLAFWKACKAELARLFERWDVILNAIDARHVRALRWADGLGFCVADPEPMGVQGLPFCRVVLTKEDLHHV